MGFITTKPPLPFARFLCLVHCSSPQSTEELGGGFTIFYFHPYLGKWSNLTSTFFEGGWFNHQLEKQIPKLYQWSFLVPLIGGRWYIITQLAIYKWYILPIGWLYITYHLLGEPETNIDYSVFFVTLVSDVRKVNRWFPFPPRLCEDAKSVYLFPSMWLIAITIHVSQFSTSS